MLAVLIPGKLLRIGVARFQEKEIFSLNPSLISSFVEKIKIKIKRKTNQLYFFVLTD